MMTRQTISPAGAGHETRLVMLACAIILLLATLGILLGTQHDEQRVILPGQLDARHDLTAAEQGIYADLLVATDELVAMGATPSVDELSNLLIAPFAKDVSSIRRGEHTWLLIRKEKSTAYLGITQQPQIAASFLLWLPELAVAKPADEGIAAQIWILRSQSEAVKVPDDLSKNALVHAGWRQVVSYFDAGVTRHQP